MNTLKRVPNTAYTTTLTKVPRNSLLYRDKAESNMMGGRRMLKKRSAVNLGNSSNLFSALSWSSTLSMKSPQTIPTTISTQDSGRIFSRKWMWWNIILRMLAVISIPVKRIGLENSPHLHEAEKFSFSIYKENFDASPLWHLAESYNTTLDKNIS